MKKPQLAVIGVQGFAQSYVNNYCRLQDAGVADFAAAVVRNKVKAAEVVEKLAARGVEIYPSAEELYAKRPDIDLMGIPTGIAFHETMTAEALEHGCNVLVEKPASGSVASVDRMIAAAAKRPEQFVMVGFQHMADRNLRYLKSRLLTGELGKVLEIRVHGLWPRGDVYYHRNNWAGKRFAADGTPVWDSPVNNAFAHYLNIALFLAADRLWRTAAPATMQAMLLRAREEIETFDSCAFALTTDTGVRIVEFLSHTGGANVSPRIKISCERGSIDWECAGTWSFMDGEGKVLASGCDVRPNAVMFDDAVRKLADRSVLTCTLEMARNQVCCIEAMHQHFEPFVLSRGLVSRREEDGVLTVKGLEEFGNQVFATGKLCPACGMTRVPDEVQL